MNIHISKKWPEMAVKTDMWSQFYIETVYILVSFIFVYNATICTKSTNLTKRNIPGHSSNSVWVCYYLLSTYNTMAFQCTVDV